VAHSKGLLHSITGTHKNNQPLATDMPGMQSWYIASHSSRALSPS